MGLLGVFLAAASWSSAGAVDCVSSGWGSWGACSRTCGGGEQSAAPVVSTPASGGGAACPAPLERVCSGAACAPAAGLACAFSANACGWKLDASAAALAGGGGGVWVWERSADGGGELVLPTSALTPGAEATVYSPVVLPPSSGGALSAVFSFRVFASELFVDQAAPPFPAVSSAAQGAAVDASNSDPREWRWTAAYNYSGTHVQSGWHEASVAVPLVPTPGATPAQWRPVALRLRGRALLGGRGDGAGGIVVDRITVGTAQDCVWSGWSAWGACSSACGGGREERFAVTSTAGGFGGKACPKKQARPCQAAAANAACAPSVLSTVFSGTPLFGAWVNANGASAADIAGSGMPTPAATSAVRLHDWLSVTPTSSSASTPSGTADGDGHLSVQLQTQHDGIAAALLLSPAVNLSAPSGAHFSADVKFATRNGAALYLDAQQRNADGSWSALASSWTMLWSSATGVPAAEAAAAAAGAWQQRSISLAALASSPTVSHRLRLRALVPANVTTGLAALITPTVAVDHMKLSNAKVDCVASGWAAWGACSATCNGGTQQRTATIATPSAFGGTPCPAPQTQACNTGGCPRDCVVAAWGAWDACSSTCGGGTQSRQRSVDTAAANGGGACSSNLAETQSCNQGSCPNVVVACVVTAWLPWGACGAQCSAVDGGDGVTTMKQRVRQVTTPAANGGQACPALAESTPCNTQRCPVPCSVSAWGSWGACAVTCGGGWRNRTRTVVTAAAHAGSACPALNDGLRCAVAACVTACQVSAWEPTTSCMATCGDGFRIKHRTVATQTNGNGTACGALHEATPCTSTYASLEGYCETAVAKRDCAPNAWGSWGTCTAACVGGVQVRTRSVDQANYPAKGGAACGSLVDQRQCNTNVCAEDCVVSEWQSHTACTATCGGGTLTRTRSVVSEATLGGMRCPKLVEAIACNSAPCPVDCAVTLWQAWGECSIECSAAGGLATRLRTVATSAARGGASCPALSETRACNVHVCPSNCAVSGWSPWAECSRTCGGGTHTRTRSVISQSAGASCPPLSETQSCSTDPCAVDCAVTNWASATACTASCGGGQRQQTRTVTTPALYGGAACPSLQRNVLCGGALCPQDCTVSEWSGWGQCSKDCGGGSQQRERAVLQSTAHGGKACPILVEAKACNTAICMVACTVSEWSVWGACGATCGATTQSRKRTIVAEASGGGAACPALTDTRGCDPISCPQQCVVGAWGAWGTCTKNCGGGQRQRVREVTHAATDAGDCPFPLVDHTSCNTAACSGAQANVDCVLSDWSSWGMCSRPCSGGAQMRARTVLASASGLGVVCNANALSESKVCNPQACPVDCLVSGWSYVFARRVFHHGDCDQDWVGGGCTTFSSWTSCTKTCGNGTRTLVRNVTRLSAHGGANCPRLNETQPCETQRCPVDCRVSAWNSEGKCDRDCGGGKRVFTRTILTGPIFQTHPTDSSLASGAACPVLNKTETCNTQSCDRNCIVSDWSAWSACDRSCDGGSQWHTRTVVVPALFSGLACPALNETTVCNAQQCPVDCQAASQWGSFSACSASCGSGTKLRFRSTTQAKHGGRACEAADRGDRRNCTTADSGFQESCPVDCALSAWSDWSACSRTCGDSSQRQRSRTVTIDAAHGGTPCPARSALFEVKACPSGGDCPVDCAMLPWGSFGPCSKTCGGGVQLRSRNLLLAAKNNGKPCPLQVQNANCEEALCAAPAVSNQQSACTMAPWSEWSACTRVEDGKTVAARCGGGARKRTRTSVSGWCPPVQNPRSEEGLCNQAPCELCCWYLNVTLQLRGDVAAGIIAANPVGFNATLAAAMGVPISKIISITKRPGTVGRRQLSSAPPAYEIQCAASSALHATTLERVTTNTENGGFVAMVATMAKRKGLELLQGDFSPVS